MKAGIAIPAPSAASNHIHAGEGEGEEEEMVDGDPIVDAVTGHVEIEDARDEIEGEASGVAAPTSGLTSNTAAATSGLTSDTATSGLTSDTAPATSGLTSEDNPMVSIVPPRKKPKHTGSTSGADTCDTIHPLNPEAEPKREAKELPGEVAESMELPKRKAECKPNPDPPLKKATPLKDLDMKKAIERDDGTGP